MKIIFWKYRHPKYLDKVPTAKDKNWSDG